MKKLVYATCALCAFYAAPASAGSLVFQNSYNLSPALEAASSNYHPQGIGYDASANELLFIQQSTNTIYRTDLTGTILGSRTIGPITLNAGGQKSSTARHTVSVAADALNYYFSDYTANTFGYDLYSLGKTAGAATAISAETAAFGGYPIDIEGGLLFRTEPSTTYSYSNLDQIRVSALSNPDTILQTLTLTGAAGIADFTVDAASGSIFTLDYTTNASIRRYDLNTGALLDTFAPTVEGTTAGLTFANGNLYVYDWQQGASTLQVYAVQGLNNQGAVPEPSTWAMMLLGFGFVGSAIRSAKRRKKLTVTYA